MSARPAIGICTAVERAQWGVWDLPACLLPRNYLEAIQRAGGLALMLPPDPAVTAQPDVVLDLLDGLILAGGVDMDPATYGAERHPATDRPARDRDDFELALAARALERDLPFLGICRGMQVMNVARGGTLVQDLPSTPHHRPVLGTFDGADHYVRLEPDSLAARAAGEERHAAKSHHHQGVERVGEGLVVTGRAEADDLPEALEDPRRRFALGVQWHPEGDETSRLIAALVEEAAGRRAAAGP